MTIIYGFVLPFDISTFIVYLINTVVAFIAIIMSDQAIAHNIEPKKAFTLSLICFFIIPLAAPYIGFYGVYATFLLPLIAWVAFGELVLEQDKMTKLKVLGVAFAAYYILSLFVSPFIHGLLITLIPF